MIETLPTTLTCAKIGLHKANGARSGTPHAALTTNTKGSRAMANDLSYHTPLFCPQLNSPMIGGVP